MNIFQKIKDIFSYLYPRPLDLEGGGERVDIFWKNNPGFDAFDQYQKTHWLRYEFAKEYIQKSDICADFACGTAYGTMTLAQHAQSVIGVDSNTEVIQVVKERYLRQSNMQLIPGDLLAIDFVQMFNKIISFETLEHFTEKDILKLLSSFHRALKNSGKLIFSTPYLQEKSKRALEMGFHKTYEIDETKVQQWMENTGFRLELLKFQNYHSYTIENQLDIKHFIIGIAIKV